VILIQNKGCGLEFLLNTESRLSLAVLFLVVIVLLNVLIVSLIIFFRIKLFLNAKKEKAFLDVWRPIITLCAFEKYSDLPEMDKRFIMLFINEWNVLYEKLGGDSHENLVDLAIRQKIHQYAIGLLISGRRSDQLTAITTLGNIRADNAWNPLAAIAQSFSVINSLAAFNACTKISPERVFAELFPLVISRKDWPTVLTARILRNLNSLDVCKNLYEQIDKCESENLTNVLKLIGSSKCFDIYGPIKKILEKSDDPSIIALCLKALNDPRAIDTAVKFSTHAVNFVRMQAAVSLGRIGGKDEIPLLMTLVCDADWWVRYRASQALVSLPFLNKNDILLLKEELGDQYGVGMLEQVLSENEVHEMLGKA